MFFEFLWKLYFNHKYTLLILTLFVNTSSISASVLCTNVFTAQKPKLEDLIAWGGRKDKSYQTALNLVKRGTSKKSKQEVEISDVEPLSFDHFLRGLKTLEQDKLLFYNTQHFVHFLAKKRRWTSKSKSKTLGFKASEVEVGVLLKNGEVIYTSLYIVDSGGKLGDHRQLWQAVFEAYPEYRRPFSFISNDQIGIAKTPGESRVKFFVSNDLQLRSEMEYKNDGLAPIESWHRDIESIQLGKLKDYLKEVNEVSQAEAASTSSNQISLESSIKNTIDTNHPLRKNSQEHYEVSLILVRKLYEIYRSETKDAEGNVSTSLAEIIKKTPELKKIGAEGIQRALSVISDATQKIDVSALYIKTTFNGVSLVKDYSSIHILPDIMHLQL